MFRRALTIALTTAITLCAAAPALAHSGLDARRAGWTDWTFDPVLWLNFVLASWLYARGLSRLWRRTGPGRVITGWHAASFAAGILVLVAALASPIDALSGQLSWVHMVQHMLLMNVAAPLIVAAAPLYVSLWGLGPDGRRAYSRIRRRFDTWRVPWYILWQPVILWAVYALALWLWHWPPLYEAALRQPLVHDLQHVTFFAAATLFWRVLLDPLSRWRMCAAPAVLYLFTTSLHATVLGVLLTVAPAVWYGDYEGRTVLYGLSALEDQQLAGLVMWMPACLAYVVVASGLLLAWLERQGGKTGALPGHNSRRGSTSALPGKQPVLHQQPHVLHEEATS